MESPAGAQGEARTGSDYRECGALKMAKNNSGSGKSIYGNYPQSAESKEVADAALEQASEASRANVANGPQVSDKRDSCMPEEK